MLNDMTRRKIAEIKMKYDFEKQEAAIQELEEKNKNFRFRMVSIASMFILAVVLLVVTANRYQIKKQYSAQLEENLERSQKDPVKQQQNKKAISYAMKAQESFHMEGAPAFMNIFTNYFVVKKPKQEVGGDLYWVTLKGDQITIVVADCPGHGLAGSFNAIILNSILMQITSENHHQTPADILKKLNKRLIQFLDPQENAGIQQGSMAAVLSFNINTKRLIYAGAKIPLYYIRNNNLLIVPPDKNDIGGSIYAEARNYNNKIISLQKNDRLLVFTDGYRKQFGGDTKETRFTERNLRQLLSDTATSPLDVQKDILLRSFQQWKKDRPQTDDLLVLGIEV
jgi:serine phosphatase RsbU (regulator of sigma subunit)